MTVEGMDMTGYRDKHIGGHTEMIDLSQQVLMVT